MRPLMDEFTETPCLFESRRDCNFVKMCLWVDRKDLQFMQNLKYEFREAAEENIVGSSMMYKM